MEENKIEKIEDAGAAPPAAEGEKSGGDAEAGPTRKLVGIRFSPAGKIYSFDAGETRLEISDLAVVEGDKAPVIGRVIVPVYEEKAGNVPKNIKKVVRKAEPEDAEKYAANREDAMAAYHICREKIDRHGLAMMKLVDVDILAGDSKAIFYFTAEERVDFRGLVKDLAGTLHMRIEMRQIGARDAAKCIGSIGSCGRVCCCEEYLRNFRSISIQMAKHQCLAPNPAKLTGMCGKLKCCLQYEDDMYVEMKKTLPAAGSAVETPAGNGHVSNIDVPRQMVYVVLEETNKEARFGLGEIKLLRKKDAVKKDVIPPFPPLEKGGKGGLDGTGKKEGEKA